MQSILVGSDKGVFEFVACEDRKGSGWVCPLLRNVLTIEINSRVLLVRSMNRAALAGGALAKERRELKQQEANDEADSEARDFSQPWLDPMAQSGDKVFAQDLRGNLMGT